MEGQAKNKGDYPLPHKENSERVFYGLLGYPLGHSFSRAFFNDKFAREGINAEYLNFELPSADLLPQVIEEHPTLCGLNVTIPHKQAVIPFLDEISEEARMIGAVNVIRIKRLEDSTRPYFLKGFNSDIIGFTDSLRPLLQPHHRKALVLGTGGASKAICVGLEKLGIEWRYVSRQRPSHTAVPSSSIPSPTAAVPPSSIPSPTAAVPPSSIPSPTAAVPATLIPSPTAAVPAPSGAVAPSLTYADLTPALLAEYTVIVNCTPLGMFPKVDACPDIPYDALTPQHLLYDLVYNPEETLFLKQGREHGATVKGGLEMLHRQALASWDFWNGKE